MCFMSVPGKKTYNDLVMKLIKNQDVEKNIANEMKKEREKYTFFAINMTNENNYLLTFYSSRVVLDKYFYR